jgi:hypothetical protein
LQADLDGILEVEAPTRRALQGGILMPETSQRTAVFDIIGTCFSLEKPRHALGKLGAPDYALEMWFAQALRDSFAFSHAGPTYRSMTCCGLSLREPPFSLACSCPITTSVV